MFKFSIATLVALILCGVCNVQSQPIQGKTPASSSSAKRQIPGPNLGVAKNQPLNLESIAEVLWWLPEDTETVSVVRGPFKTVAPLREQPENTSAMEFVDLALRTIPFGLLQTIKTGRFYKALVGRNILFCVEGSRRFRAPTSLGGMLYEGCNVIILKPGLGPERAPLIRQMTSNAKQLETIAGQRVMVFEEKLEEDIWKIFVAIPSPDVLLCATNRDYLTQVLKRMHQKGQKRALPEDLPEWNHVNTRAKFWAVRHYNKDDKQSDPTSPLSREETAAPWSDKQAVGIVFNLDPSRSKVATVKYLSTNKDALKLFADYHAKVGQGFNPEIRQNGAGVVEMLISLDDRDQAAMFLFVLLGLLGHATYV